MDEKQPDIIELGQPARDKVSGLKGAATHLYVRADGKRSYLFQPRGLNRQTGQPLAAMVVSEDRLEGRKVPFPTLPLEVLNTKVTDRASGFKGTAVAVVLHVNGCVHVDVQPKGLQPKSGEPIEVHNFDIRMLEGDAIKKMTDEQVKKSREKNPSPVAMGSGFRGLS